MRHTVEVYVQAEGKFAALATRMLGPALPKNAEQACNSLLLFFSLMARQLDRHPEQVQALFGPAGR